MTPERESRLRSHLALAREAGDLTIGDIYAGELLGELDAAREALRLAESDGDSARRDLTTAYKILVGVMPGSRPASVSRAAKKAARMIRDHDAERRRVLGERDAAREQVARVKQVRVWTNEDGKGFVFSDDLRAALDGTPP